MVDASRSDHAVTSHLLLASLLHGIIAGCVQEDSFGNVRSSSIFVELQEHTGSHPLVWSPLIRVIGKRVHEPQQKR
ncbi:hypothetical protein Pelo_19136 [Pelomyxa schiedti]|nr:hypothetical protein Pelo_19136 [Pelomyxa schiedti]